MKTPLNEDIILITDDDDEFIQWCRENPNGFFWSCHRTLKREVTRVVTLHAAIVNGDLCRHFKNRNSPTGYTPHTTQNPLGKVCCLDRKKLEAWAASHPEPEPRSFCRCLNAP